MSNKSRILYILRYLETQTDENHPAAIADIVAYLGSIGIKADRRNVSADIELLMEYGIDIICNTGRRNEYFIGERIFELPEVKLLADAVEASLFISPNKSMALKKKITALAGVHQAEEILSNTHVELRAKSTNEMFYIIADMLRNAISSQKQIHFKYYDYDSSKQKIFKHNGQVYEFSPYGLIWNGDNYYAIGHSESHGKIITFRADMIAMPTMTDIPAIPCPKDFDISAYANSVFRMYDGPMREVTLKCPNSLMRKIVDRFGEAVPVEAVDTEHFHAVVTVAVSKTFFGWVFTYCGEIEIAGPQEVREEYLRMARIIAGKSEKE